MIPIEYLWYIIGVVSVPVFILIYLKALKRNRADKARVAMRRKRFDRMMKSREPNKSSNRVNIKSKGGESLKRAKSPVLISQPANERIASVAESPASEWIAKAVGNSASDRIESSEVNNERDSKSCAVVNSPTDEHWLSEVKLPTKRESSPKHWLECLKPKRSRHWLDNLRR